MAIILNPLAKISGLLRPKNSKVKSPPGTTEGSRSSSASSPSKPRLESSDSNKVHNYKKLLVAGLTLGTAFGLTATFTELDETVLNTFDKPVKENVNKQQLPPAPDSENNDIQFENLDLTNQTTAQLVETFKKASLAQDNAATLDYGNIKNKITENVPRLFNELTSNNIKVVATESELRTDKNTSLVLKISQDDEEHIASVFITVNPKEQSLLIFVPLSAKGHVDTSKTSLAATLDAKNKVISSTLLENSQDLEALTR